jgi:hypothetical protein
MINFDRVFAYSPFVLSQCQTSLIDHLYHIVVEHDGLWHCVEGAAESLVSDDRLEEVGAVALVALKVTPGEGEEQIGTFRLVSNGVIKMLESMGTNVGLDE